MYKLYFMPGACSRAILALLNALEQDVELIARDSVADFRQINPTNQVPVLVDGDLTLREGSAIVLHLLEKHRSSMLPDAPAERAEFYQWLLFANATLHPAYSLLFFAARGLESETAQQEVLQKAAARVSSLWSIIDQRLGDRNFIFGEEISPVDLMLAVYADWGQYFPLEIQLGDNTQRTLERVRNHPSFVRAVLQEEELVAA